ncbi:hypothetical protein BC629DRAFT_668031 [Irpex lacteus]|nr:hypothetical protein BC629DRAFT_668031 [Irpex lacteus]
MSTSNVNTPGVHAVPDIDLRSDRLQGPPSDVTSEDRTDEQQKQDAQLAERLSQCIEDANEKLIPLTNMVRKHIETFEARPEEERDQGELINAVKPLLQQAEKILNETQGVIKGADPGGKVSGRAKRHAATHQATPEEQRLAQALSVLIENVQGTIEWAKGKLDKYPKAKRDLGPLLDALGAPLTQIVAGVGMLLAGVLNLVSRILGGLGLGGLLKGILSATVRIVICSGVMCTTPNWWRFSGLDKIYKVLVLTNG